MKEMITECNAVKKSLIFVVDRWYSSTCAYSLAQHAQEAIEDISSDYFMWPHDLIKPMIVVIIHVDPTLRKKRVAERAAANNSPIEMDTNRWDSILQRDDDIANRIERALVRVGVSNVIINGNQPPEMH